MAKKGTENINDYISDYERTLNDYQNMGPLWAEMVFGDDFEAMKALYGKRGGHDDYSRYQSDNEHSGRSGKRR